MIPSFDLFVQEVEHTSRKDQNDENEELIQDYFQPFAVHNDEKSEDVSFDMNHIKAPGEPLNIFPEKL